MPQFSPGLYSSRYGTIRVVQIKDNRIWACSRNYPAEEAKPHWDLAGHYLEPGPPGLYDLGEAVADRGPAAFSEDPAFARFNWENLTERRMQEHKRKHGHT